ncbi:flagellar export chaperone FlgN [Vibrio sp.]|uniref:flagellar export chaperone FlgN n=1 Tax=Vibrio sp. TaxID=678 RepID=UPI003F6B2D98
MATAASQHIQQVLHSVTEDIKLYQQLLVLIQQQKGLYLQFDSKVLDENIQKQKPILNQLARTSSERSQWMRALGLSCNNASMQRIFNALPTKMSIQVRKQWALLESLVKQCQQDNQSNAQSSAAFQELITQIKQPLQHTYEEHSV